MSCELHRTTDPTKTEMSVFLRGKKYEDCTGDTARQAAQRYAAETGFMVRGMANQPAPYPVNKDGEASEKCAIGMEPIEAFEIEYRFVRMM